MTRNADLIHKIYMMFQALRVLSKLKKNKQVQRGTHFPVTLNILQQTIPHTLCRFEMKDMHGLQCFSSTDSDGSENLPFTLCLNQEIFFK